MSDVSVIIVTYNSDWKKLRLTLLSTLKQINVSIQIIIADDGSKETFDEKIVQLFNEFGFSNYVIVNNPVSYTHLDVYKRQDYRRITLRSMKV